MNILKDHFLVKILIIVISSLSDIVWVRKFIEKNSRPYYIILMSYFECSYFRDRNIVILYNLYISHNFLYIFYTLIVQFLEKIFLFAYMLIKMFRTINAYFYIYNKWLFLSLVELQNLLLLVKIFNALLRIIYMAISLHISLLFNMIYIIYIIFLLQLGQ